MLGKILNLLFKSKEQKYIEAQAEFVCRDIELDEHLKSLYFKKALPGNMDFYLEEMEKDREKIPGWIALYIANGLADMLESGRYCVYRGVLSPEGQWNFTSLRKAYDIAIKHKVITEAQARENIQIISNNIREVG